MQAYLAQLETLQSELTRAGEIETAVVVKNEAERIRISMAGEGDSAAGPKPAAATSEPIAGLEAIPEMNIAPVDGGIFKLEQWPPKVALPQGNYRIEGSFTEKWNSKLFGLQMVNCEVERVEFPSIEYDKEDEPSEFAGQDWAMVRKTHFRKCVIPVSVLSLLDGCSFEECRFIDDPGPVVFATKITRTIYLENCQWNVKALPAEFVVEQKKMSEMP